MSALHRVGVRHHSPACARLVESTLRAIRPRTVLIEGPSDLNGRLGELLLDHDLPVALFSFLRVDGGMARASWYPLCSYSPEWVALRVGHELGADVVFMDLPSWHDAFADVVNLGADRADRYGEAIEVLCARTGASGLDALWDHLFESVEDTVVLAEALDRYFDEVRELSPVSDRDAAREEHMRAHVATARARGGDVVVVCGGYHSPVLDVAAGPTTDWPLPPAAPEGGRAETYLVPYSYRRLDAFTGYQSGMPSPAYYEALHQLGAAAAADRFFETAIRRLREVKQQVSTADLVAVRAQTDALAALRAHRAPLRVDLLDGLASALLKDAADQPFPWDRRGPLHPRTHPILVELVAAFSGDRIGRLDQATPRPPLLADARAEMEACDAAPGAAPRTRTLDLTRPEHRRGSVTLHRLRVLAIPGFDRHGSGLAVEESWTLTDDGGADVALIEASIHGPTLATAAAGRLTATLDSTVAVPPAAPASQVLPASPTGVGAVPLAGADAVAAVLLDALHCGLDQLAAGTLVLAGAAIDASSDLAALGRALDTLAVILAADDLVAGSAAFRAEVESIADRALRRFLWLLESIVGPSGPQDEGIVNGLVALCRAVRRSGIDLGLVGGVLERRSLDLAAPPAVRGACLGALWQLGLFDQPTVSSRGETDKPCEGDAPPVSSRGETDKPCEGDAPPVSSRGETDNGPDQDLDGMDRAVAALRLLPPDQQPGDFLSGLFATARTLAVTDDRLVGAIDELVGSWSADDFLVLLPGLRRAFAWFPPRERSRIGDRIAALRGLAPTTRLTGQLTVDPMAVAAGAALDQRIDELMARYGLVGPVPATGTEAAR